MDGPLAYWLGTWSPILRQLGSIPRGALNFLDFDLISVNELREWMFVASESNFCYLIDPKKAFFFEIKLNLWKIILEREKIMTI